MYVLGGETMETLIHILIAFDQEEFKEKLEKLVRRYNDTGELVFIKSVFPISDNEFEILLEVNEEFSREHISKRKFIRPPLFFQYKPIG